MDQSIRLECKEGGSNKFYEIMLFRTKKGWMVMAANGRIGSAATKQAKTAVPVELVDAQKIYDKLINEKRKGGYKPVGVDVTTMVGVTDRQDSGLRPQLLNSIDESNMESYFQHPHYCMQEKNDGRRLMVKIDQTDTETVITGVNRTGEVIPLAQSLVDDLNSSLWPLGQMVPDGEWMGDRYMVFDLLESGAVDLRLLPYKRRYFILTQAFGQTKLAVPVETAWTEPEKRALFARIKAAHGEGVVFKDIHAPFSEGRPSKGGTQLKYKFWETADAVIVTSQSKAVRSAGMGLYKNGQMVYVGQVTIPANYDIPHLGEVAQVRYLYAYRGGSIYQPQYEGTRDDKSPDECLLSQLKFKPESGEEE